MKTKILIHPQTWKIIIPWLGMREPWLVSGMILQESLPGSHLKNDLFKKQKGKGGEESLPKTSWRTQGSLVVTPNFSELQQSHQIKTKTAWVFITSFEPTTNFWPKKTEVWITTDLSTTLFCHNPQLLKALRNLEGGFYVKGMARVVSRHM